MLKRLNDIKLVFIAALFLILNGHFNYVLCQDLLPDSLMKERIDVISTMLCEGKKGANIWWKGWLVGYSAATVAQTAVAITSDDLKGRQDWSLGALSTLLGAAGQLISPMPKGYTADLLTPMPEETSADLQVKLTKAEQLLQECAEREQAGRSWKIHALDGAVNLGFGAVVWLGFKRSFTAGAGNFALNTAICEAQIFSQPKRAIKDFNRYVQKYKSADAAGFQSNEVTWYFTMMPGGLGVKIVF